MSWAKSSLLMELAPLDEIDWHANYSCLPLRSSRPRSIRLPALDLQNAKLFQGQLHVARYIKNGGPNNYLLVIVILRTPVIIGQLELGAISPAKLFVTLVLL